MESSNGGMGFVGALTILFVALKLTGAVDWSWLWVLSPVWATILLVVAVIAAPLVVAAVRSTVDRFRK